MIRNKKQKRTYSLVGNTKLLIFIAIFLIVINMVVSAISIINIRQQNSDAVQNSVSLFQRDISTNLRAIQHFIQWTVLKELLIETLEETSNGYEQFLAIDALRIRVENNQIATGNNFCYFLYLKEQNQFFNASEMHFPYEDFLKIKKYIIENANSKGKHTFTWKFKEINGTTYLNCILVYYNRTFATFINVTDLFAPLSNMDFGEQGTLVITDLNENIVFTNSKDEGHSTQPFLYSLHTFEGTDTTLPYTIYLYSDNFHNYGRLFLFQLFVIITSMVVCLILTAFILNLYRKAIRPIQEFSANLANLNEESNLLDLQSNRVRELEQANTQFKNLMHEIKHLKINIYENELEKKHSQITFLQHQIRPHFYLNCLTTISSMAQLEDYKNIESMVLFTSRYLRYLFQTDKELLCIEYELSHIQAYLDIQQLRLGSFFTYTCSIDETDREALIPPLLLITFIENTIKHNTNTTNNLEIQLSVTKEQENNELFLKICITDSGQGFPEEILKKLTSGNRIETDERNHVGIANSMKRLTLMYGENHEIHFSNREQGGAHIQLLIPYQI